MPPRRSYIANDRGLCGPKSIFGPSGPRGSARSAVFSIVTTTRLDGPDPDGWRFNPAPRPAQTCINLRRLRSFNLEGPEARR